MNYIPIHDTEFKSTEFAKFQKIPESWFFLSVSPGFADLSGSDMSVEI